jgi:hypothetical protein
MGTKPAPSYADNFMARRIDQRIMDLAKKYGKLNQNPLTIFKRFLDDIFTIFCGNSKDLHHLLMR